MRLLRIPAAWFAVMALVAFVLGVVEAAATQRDRAVVGVGGALILIGYAAFLGWIAQGLWRARPRAHAASLAVALVHLPVAWSFADGSTWWIAALLATGSVVTLVIGVLPRSMRAVGRIGDAGE